jgi:copper chaperone CopZ
MKKIVMMTLAALFAVNVLADNVKFKVTNMHCENCAKRAEKALKANEGVSEVKVNLECKAVCVTFDAQKTNVETLQKALTDVKFEAEVAKQCNDKEGCKHEAGHKCDQKGEQQEKKHECGADGCGHNEEKTQE